MTNGIKVRKLATGRPIPAEITALVSLRKNRTDILAWFPEEGQTKATRAALKAAGELCGEIATELNPCRVRLLKLERSLNDILSLGGHALKPAEIVKAIK